jgi:acetyl esterase/lipase
MGDLQMTAAFSALDWRSMSQDERDRGLNNGTAVAGSADLVAGWERRSAAIRQRHSQYLDLRYGPRERNRIDFIKAADAAPTLLFIHGGYWQNRAKEVFSIFAEGPMAHGINVALIGYTLAPDATLDEIVAEIHAGIDYLAGQLPELGAAGEGIVVSGWSAGGHLTSMALSNSHVRAGMAISGIYDLRPLVGVDWLNADLGLDEATALKLSPAFLPTATRAPVMTCVGGDESSEFKRQNALLGERWRGAFAGDIAMPGRHHFSIVDGLAEQSSPLFAGVRKLMKLDK